MTSDAPKALNRLGQSLWLDNITRDLLDSGTLKRYIDELSITGLTSNPTIFDHAISRSSRYDAEIGRQLDSGATGEGLFFNLAIEDLSRAADLFAPVHARTCQSAPKFDPGLECAPEGGRFQAVGLTVCRACWSSNCTGLRYPSAEWSLRAL